MCPVRQTAGVQQLEMADQSAIKVWLDALASGACDQAMFLLSMQERFKSDADGNWEVLSQLDQYYRRGRIKAEVFHSVKKALAESALGGRSVPVTDIEVAHEGPEVSEIPVAREIAIPPLTRNEPPLTRNEPPLTRNEPPLTRSEPPLTRTEPPLTRTELSDAHSHREESLDAPGELRPGSVLRRRYRLENILGQGEMGRVFQALDEYRLETPQGGQKLAIKVLHTSVSKRAELLTQLRREFQQLQLLSHPNILRVFEFDRDGPVVFFTMELLNGPLLSRVLQARKLIPLERPQALAIVRDIGAAIGYAHSRGVVHGSINPQNIFITIPGEVRVIDFAAAHRSNRRSSTPDHEMTMPFATSAYASCQVLEGDRPDARDDVFAIACIAYLLLSGEHPFSKKTAIEARQARLSPRRPPKLTNRQWHAIRAGLRWEREDRPANVQEWLERLDLGGAARQLAPITDLIEAPPRKEPKSVFAMTMVAGAVILLAGAAWFISNRGVLPQLDSNPPIHVDAASPSPTETPAPPAPEAPAPIAHSTSQPTTSHDTPAPAPTVAPPTAAPRVAASPKVAPPTVAPPTVAPPTAAPSIAASTNSVPPALAPPTAAPRTAAPSVAPTVPAIVAPGAGVPRAATKSAATPSSPPSAGVSSGPSRIEMAADNIEVPAAELLAQVSVNRKGNLRGETTFTWWTESGTAKPGIDFTPVVPQLAHVGDGKSSFSVSIPLSNAPRTRSKSFYVVIDQSEGGAVLGARTLTMITLLPSD
jgi:serine/threonine protein kinase